MPQVKILSVDPSLRNTGLVVVTYDLEMEKHDSDAYKLSHCQVIANPKKYKDKEGITHMLSLLQEQSKKPCYTDVDFVLVESPFFIFNPEWGVGTMSAIAHISGGATVIFGIEKAFLIRPHEWNNCRKKEVSLKKTMHFFGEPRSWHFESKIRSDKRLEHIVDAAGMALWFVRNNAFVLNE